MESGSNNEPIGLYKHRITGTYLGAIDETQANAFVGLGYDIVETGIEAAKMTETEIDTKFGKKAESPQEPAKKGR